MAFSRDEWSRLRDQTPLLLTEADLFALRGLNDQVTLSLVEQIYLPLARLLNLYVAATQTLHKATDTFLSSQAAKVPYVIGVAGSVAVGKSTTARILQALLSQWPDHPHVDLVTTDGFLHPNAVLESRGLMHRKGFPASYDVRRLLEFLIEVKSGKAHVAAPVYSHLSYDVVPDRVQDVNRPDIMILEGLNVLQTAPRQQGRALFVSDFFDFSIYIDADAKDIQNWYVDRFMTLRETVFTDAKSVLSPLRGAERPRSPRGGLAALARDQPRQPAREHRAHPRARASDHRERIGSRSDVCALAEALICSSDRR